ncbi:MAG: hypothetical protein ACLR5S_11245 [Ruminococcus sp.]
MIASGGTPPTLQQPKLPAEQANFSFGQGVLTASPADRQNDPCYRQRRHARQCGWCVVSRMTAGRCCGKSVASGIGNCTGNSGISPPADVTLPPTRTSGRPAHVSMGAKPPPPRPGAVTLTGPSTVTAG